MDTLIMYTLTRGAAIDLVAEYATEGLTALLDLQEHWIGHRDYVPEASESETIAELSAVLCEYVDDCAEALQDRRVFGCTTTSPDDLTDLVAP